jgi:(1->4)-alpha-D-glucan 1-alpha-D-glucosylmutase
MLDGLKNVAPADLLHTWPDGRIKLFLTQRLLRLRREYATFFKRSNYLPLAVSGELADCCIGFARQHQGRSLLVLTTRLSSRVGFPATGERWKDTRVQLPDTVSLDCMTDVFTGRKLRTNNRELEIADAMAVLPFAVYTSAL